MVAAAMRLVHAIGRGLFSLWVWSIGFSWMLFAASITLGEVLVAERRFLFYALAPILYNAGIVAGTVLLHDQLGIKAAAVGAVIGASLHLGIRVVGMLRSEVALRFRLDVRLPAIRVPPMG